MYRVTYLRNFVLLLAAALLVWRIASLGLSAHYAQPSKEGVEAADKALAWNGRNPEALVRRALALRTDAPEAAASLLAQAYAENPAAVRTLVVMAEMAQAQGDETRSQALLDTAVKLAPADPWVHRQAADYWVERGDLERALRHWSTALETAPESKVRLFPVLLKIAEDPGIRLAFKPFAASPPSWWEAFFTEVAAEASDVETVRVLYALRRESQQAPVMDAERKAYVARMMKSGYVAEAYVDWMSGLGREQRQQLGFLHDGGFELEPSQWGFGWRIRSRPQALVDRGSTYGVAGEKALHLLFRNHEGRFAGVSQLLFLDPGPYRLSGKVSTDSLESRGGIQWRVRCLLPEPLELGASERFLGANEWRDFGFEFEVPTSCVLQEVRLVSAGKRNFEHKITGGAWFDRLFIRKIPELTAPANVAPIAPADAAPATADNQAAGASP